MAALLLAATAVWLVVLTRGTYAPFVALAILPIAGWALVTLVLVRRGGVPSTAMAAAFLWGAAAAAPLSATLNDALRVRHGGVAGTASWGTFAALGAPVVEEVCKGAALMLLPLLARRGTGNLVLAGVALGAASGLGFAVTENVGYLTVAALQGGLPGLLQAAWARGVLSGVKHALFTASTGAGLGLALDARRRGPAVGLACGGFAVALLQHGAWNGLAAPLLHDVLCDAPGPAAGCAAAAGPLQILVLAPLIVGAALAPGALGLLWLARRERRRETSVPEGGPRRASRPDRG